METRHVRFGSKANMCGATRDVRFVPIADIAPVNCGVRYSPEAGTALFCLGPNAFVQEARAVLHFDLLLLHPLFALAQL